MTPVLTGKERAILTVRAICAGEEPDPAINSGLTREQHVEFNRYLTLDYVANCLFNGFVSVLANMAIQIDNEYTRFELLNWGASELETVLQETPDRRAIRNWRKVEPISVPLFMRGLTEEYRHSLIEDLEVAGRNLAALEAVQAEIAAEYDGFDPLRPEIRERMNTARKTIESLAGKLIGHKKMPRADEALLDQYRSEVDVAFQQLGLLKHE